MTFNNKGKKLIFSKPIITSDNVINMNLIKKDENKHLIKKPIKTINPVDDFKISNQELTNNNTYITNFNNRMSNTSLLNNKLLDEDTDFYILGDLKNSMDSINNKESRSNFKNMSYSKKDQYYRKAKEEGFRARSVYKLKEIQENFKIINDSKNILDLCAAPGSWSQMLRSMAPIESKICSVDIQYIVPIEGVNTIQGDITKQSTLKNILDYFKNEKLQLVVFDGAPDVTGIIEMDINMQTQLITCSLIMCTKLLEKGKGKFVAKVFKDDDNDYYYDKAKLIFDYVTFYKPSSSRATSNEYFLIGEGFNVDDNILETFEYMNLEDIFKLSSYGSHTIREIFKNNYTSSFNDNNNSKFLSDINILNYNKKVVEFIINLFEILN